MKKERNFMFEAFAMLEKLCSRRVPLLRDIRAARELIKEAENTKYEPPRPLEPLYKKLVSASMAATNCEKSGNKKWLAAHKRRIKSIMDTAPSGAGIDSGTHLLKCSEKEIVLRVDFHHLNEHGSYDGWTSHVVTVKPSLFDSFVISISGRNQDDIKEHLHQVFYDWLWSQVDEV